LEILHDGSDVKPLAYNVVINLLRFVSRESFLDLINIKSASDTDAKSWKLRALLWRSLLVYNGVIKLVVAKHVPPLSMFSYGPQLFPASLTTVAPISEELKEAMEGLTNEARIVSDVGGRWLFVEINLEFSVREPATIKSCGGPDLDMLEMMHIQYACAVGVSRQLSEETGFAFVPKPLDSLLDKAFFRQKDIHDLIRTKVPKDGMADLVDQLKAMKLAVYERKRTKLGNESVIMHGCCTTIWSYNAFIWIEVQEEIPEKKIQGSDHIEYEINRSVRSDRYEDLLEKEGKFAEVSIPEADDKIDDLFDSLSRFEEG